MASPSPPPEVIAAAIAKVKQLFGSSFIGFTVATAIFGISVLQSYLYYRNYPKDSIYFKLTVGVLWGLDALSTTMVAHSLYTFFVFNFGDLTADGFIPWSFALENGLLTMITIIAQCFYAYQIWSVSHSKIVTGGILFLAFTAFGIGLNITVHLFQHKALTSLAERKFLIVSGLVQGFALACDIVITVSLIFYLRSKREKGLLQTSAAMIDNLIIYAVCRGILTGVAQIMFLTLNVALPETTYWQPFHQVVGKLYVNSVIATLNLRKSIRGDVVVNHTHSITIQQPSSSRNRGTPLVFMGSSSKSHTPTNPSLDHDRGSELDDNDNKGGAIIDAV